MANKSKKNTKNIIIGACAAVVIIVLVIIAIILGTRDGGFGGLNDQYFVSDDTKYVLTYNTGEFVTDNADYQPTRFHQVYTYSGDTITGLKAYYEYDNEEDAKAAYDFYSTNDDEYKSVVRDGKYVILEAQESAYEGLTADDAKQLVEFMEQVKNVDSNEEEVVEEGEVVEGSEEVEVIEETTVEE